MLCRCLLRVRTVGPLVTYATHRTLNTSAGHSRIPSNQRIQRALFRDGAACCGDALRSSLGELGELRSSRSALAATEQRGGNYTYTAEEGALGLVAWLNELCSASPSLRAAHVTLPSGTVSRGGVSLRLPVGMHLVLQGQGMAGAAATALNLDKQNLDIGSMLGGSGRVEFRSMAITNVRARARSHCSYATRHTDRWLCVQGSSSTVREPRRRAFAVLARSEIGRLASCASRERVPPPRRRGRGAGGGGAGRRFRRI
jgi:hypothetical protein